MKLLAINGSPRKSKNTGKLLEQTVAGAKAQGADAELVHLGPFLFKGCISCFACKLPGGPSYGRCAVKDALEPVLQKAHDADVLVLGSPVYLGTESSLMRAFLERFCFQYILYSKIKPHLAPPKKATAVVYTMNIQQDHLKQFGMDVNMGITKSFMERLFGHCELLLCCDTLQFDDYSKYDNDMWDVPAKQKRHAEIFPEDLKAAYSLGARLIR